MMRVPRRSIVLFTVAILTWANIARLAYAQEPWKIRFASEYELRFFDQAAENFQEAKTLCEHNKGIMIEMYDEEITETVNVTIRSATNVTHFWIGATGTMYKWNWLNGHKVDSSFITWYNGQPDNAGGFENYLIVRKYDLKYEDIRSDFKYGGVICQRNKRDLEAWKVKFVSNYKLWFFDYPASTFHSAEGLCANNSGTIVQMFDEQIKNTVYETLKSAINMQYFWIGAKGTLYDWTWFDGTDVNGSLLNWNIGQPDNFGGNEHNLIVRKNLKYSDVLETYKHAGTICQRYSESKKPTTLNIESHSCNSSMTIKWRPHRGAVGIEHTLVIALDGDSSNREELKITPTSDLLQIFVSKPLKSSTRYTVLITPCVSCTSSFTAKSKVVTGGIPGPVARAYINKHNRSCEIYWAPPSVIPISFITGYKVTINTAVVKSPLWATVLPAEKEIIESSPFDLSYKFPTQRNRMYNVTIQSRTCAGFGEEVVVTGGCVTEVEAPSTIPTPIKSSNILQDGKLIISLLPPDEFSGPVSCLLIVVQSGDNGNQNFVMNQEKLLTLNLSFNHDEYISTAIIPHRWFTGSSITLGDNSTSSCNIRENAVGENEKIHGNYSYVGRNFPLIGYSSYRIYVVTATPLDESVLFQASDALLIQETALPSSDTVSLFVAVAVLAVLAVAGGIAVLCLVKRIRRITSQTISRPNIPREHSAIPLEQNKESGYETAAMGDKGSRPAAPVPGNSSGKNLYYNEQAMKSEPSSADAEGLYELTMSTYESMQPATATSI